MSQLLASVVSTLLWGVLIYLVGLLILDTVRRFGANDEDAE